MFGPFSVTTSLYGILPPALESMFRSALLREPHEVDKCTVALSLSKPGPPAAQFTAVDGQHGWQQPKTSIIST